jgi:hypothetical protein
MRSLYFPYLLDSAAEKNKMAKKNDINLLSGLTLKIIVNKLAIFCPSCPDYLSQRQVAGKNRRITTNAMNYSNNQANRGVAFI